MKTLEPENTLDTIFLIYKNNIADHFINAKKIMKTH